MSTTVFASHATGLNLFGIHIPVVSTEVERSANGSVPTNLTVKAVGPTGQTTTCSVANGTTMTVSGIGALNAVYSIDDCRTVPASGDAPERFIFRISIRAEGSVSIKLIPIPVNVQIDSFEVTLATDPAVHDSLQQHGFVAPAQLAPA